MINRLNIIVVAGLVINLIAGASYAANQNPWAMYGGQKGGNTGTVRPRLPQQPQFNQQAPQQTAPQQAAPKKFNYQYAPLPGEQRFAAPRQQQPYGQYQRQPYGNVPGYGFQVPVPFNGQGYGQEHGQGYGQGYGSGNLGGQFGFGMNFAPNFGASGMPFGFGMLTIPFFGGTNNYGVPNQGQFGNPYGNLYGNPYRNPYQRINPWGMGFPMF